METLSRSRPRTECTRTDALPPIVTRPFAARDIMWLRRHGESVALFDLESVIIDDRTPFGQAMSGLLDPFTSGRVSLSGAASFVLPPETGRPAGFIQLRMRQPTHDGTAEADVFAIAPALERTQGAALSWQRLIGEACHLLASSGVYRIYCAVDEADGLTLQVLRQCAFQPYANDTVFSLDGASERISSHDVNPEPPPAFAPESSEHEFAIRQLIRGALPRGVEAHEPEGWRGDRASYALRPRAARAGMVQLGARGEVVGAWRVIPGRRGTWVYVVSRENIDPGRLLESALQHVEHNSDGQRPVYCTAMGHEPNLNLSLRAAGFAPLASRFRLVRHLAARRMAPAWGELPQAAAASPPPPITRACAQRTTEATAEQDIPYIPR